MSQRSILISIVIPVYNRQAYIEECVQSLSKQTHKQLEIIIIDDGSTDDTWNVCKRLAASDSRIILLSETHKGVSCARNKGLEAASGKYVFFLDSDDVIHPLLLETLFTAAEESRAAIAGTIVRNVPYTHWDKVSALIEQDAGPAETTWQNHEETVFAMFHTQSPLGNIGGVMMRRDLIGNTRFRADLTIGEDWFFIYENLLKGASSVFLKQKWYYCRIHKHNSSNSFGFAGFWTRFLRRKLVWEKELELGRAENATIQKREAVGIYCSFLRRRVTREEMASIRKVMKTHKGELLPALSIKGKIMFVIALYIPCVYRWCYTLKHGRKKQQSIW